MSPKRSEYDVVIIGAGIAGASLAYFLAERGAGSVLVLEREQQPGFHATGRSAAVLVELDPITTWQQLAIQSAQFLRHPPDGFSEHALLEQTGIMLLLHEPVWSAVRQLAPTFEAQGIRLQLLDPAEAARRVSVLVASEIDGAVLLPEDGRLDVHELLSSYLRGAASGGVELCCEREVSALLRDGDRCAGVVVGPETIRARWVVNAAGAWAGRVATLAGASAIDIVPHRRCAMTYQLPATIDAQRWPLVVSDAHEVYFKPDSGGLLFSPMDETPMEPCDARPDELVIAEGFDRLAKLAPAITPRARGRSWAGLRSFAPDRLPVVGEDPNLAGCFWLAGQGGCGIETSPALGAIAADLIVDGCTDRFDAAELSPARFGRR